MVFVGIRQHYRKHTSRRHHHCRVGWLVGRQHDDEYFHVDTRLHFYTISVVVPNSRSKRKNCFCHVSKTHPINNAKAPKASPYLVVGHELAAGFNNLPRPGKWRSQRVTLQQMKWLLLHTARGFPAMSSSGKIYESSGLQKATGF